MDDLNTNELRHLKLCCDVRGIPTVYVNVGRLFYDMQKMLHTD